MSTFRSLSESLLTVPLIILLLSDLVYLIKQLPDSELQLGELLFLRYVGIIDRMLTSIDIQVHPQLAAASEPAAAVRVQTDHVLARRVRGERNSTLGTVDPRQDGFVVRVPDFHVHPDPWPTRHERPTGLVEELNLVVHYHRCLVRNLLDEAFSLALADVKIKSRAILQDAEQHEKYTSLF